MNLRRIPPNKLREDGSTLFSWGGGQATNLVQRKEGKAMNFKLNQGEVCCSKDKWQS